MLKLDYSNAFQKDLQKVMSKGIQKDEIQIVIEKLQNCEILDRKYCDHKLKGKLKDFRECHIRPDLLLIYKVEDSILYLKRLGSHSELF